MSSASTHWRGHAFLFGSRRATSYTSLVRRWGAVRGILVSNIVFTFGPLHFYHFARGFASLPLFAAIFLTGVFFATLFERSGNLWMVGTSMALRTRTSTERRTANSKCPDYRPTFTARAPSASDNADVAARKRSHRLLLPTLFRAAVSPQRFLCKRTSL